MRNILVFIITLLAVAGVHGAYSGAEYYQTVSIAAANVSEDGDYAVYIDLSEMPAAWWAKATARSKVVFTNGSDTKLKSYVETFNAGAKTGIAWCKPTLSASTGGTIRVQAGSTINESNDATLWSDIDCVLRYGMEEASGNLMDAAGNYTGTASNLTYSAVGVIGNGVTSNGSNSLINAGDVTQLNSVSAFTIMGWFKQTTLDQFDFLFSKHSSADSHVRVYTFTDGLLRIEISNGTYAAGNIDYSTFCVLGQPCHFATTFDGSQTGNANRLKLIIDGTQRTLNFGAYTIPATTPNLATKDYTNAYSAAYPTNSFDGMVDETRVYSAAKSANYIATDYKIQNHESSAFYTLGSTWTAGPTISSQPANDSVCISETAEYSIAATGTGTLSYQWRRYTGGAWANVGANSNSYSYVTATGNDGDSIQCNVTDDNGTTASNKVLTVFKSCTPIWSWARNPLNCRRGVAIDTNRCTFVNGTPDSMKIISVTQQ